MISKRLPTQFPAAVLRRFSDLDTAFKSVDSFVRAFETLRKRLVEVINDHGDLLDEGQLPTYTDATRPTAGNAGRVIFNTDDGKLNVDDGTNWTLPDGTTT